MCGSRQHCWITSVNDFDVVCSEFESDLVLTGSLMRQLSPFDVC